MKQYTRILLILLSVTLLGITVGCSKDSSSVDASLPITADTPEPSPEATETQSVPEDTTPTDPELSFANALDVATELADRTSGSDVIMMAGEMIGADDGASFKVGADKFEVYFFSDTDILDEAKQGTLGLEIEGFGEFSMLSKVNGNYVLLYDTENTDVIREFETLAFELSTFENSGSSPSIVANEETKVIFDNGIGIEFDSFISAYNNLVSEIDANLVATSRVENFDGIFSIIINDNLGMSIVLNTGSQEINSITFIGTGDGTMESGANVLVGMMAVMQAIDPSVDGNALILELLENADGEDARATQTVNGRMYTAMITDYFGTLLVIESE